MILLVGLGNQGQKYNHNRHNIGYMAVDAIAQDLCAGPYKSKYFGDWILHSKSGQKVGLLKAGEFMNVSGKSVAAAASFFKIPSQKIFVFHDELDLNPGQVKVKQGGGHAGHNGLKSVNACLGSSDYWRIRLGIGHPRDLAPGLTKEAVKSRVSSYVLADFNQHDRLWLDPLLKALGENYDLLIDGQISDFINKLPKSKK